MRISFDLDDTLLCLGEAVPCEPRRVPVLLRPWFKEPLRSGTVALMKELQQRGHDIWIYTSSGRSIRYIRWLFRFHGIRLDGVINQFIHERTFRDPSRPSKAPHCFQIELHIDDSEGVLREVPPDQCKVLVIEPGDANWTDKILEGLKSLRTRR